MYSIRDFYWSTYLQPQSRQGCKNDASDSAVIRTKLDNINAGVESIRIDIKAQEMRVTGLSERVIRVEESSKQAHKRLDKMEGIAHEN